MCGIAGLAVAGRESGPNSQHAVERMTRALAHRGPDGAGVWHTPDDRVVLGHRRLSIIDLSSDGAQPMHSASGRYVVTYNGEIYNFPRLQAELAALGIRFRGRSDTEILLAACEQWGVNATLQKINGMFAIALWDSAERKLHLVRDRIGKKPLYVGWAGGHVLFASELKAFHAHPNFAGNVSRDSLALYLRYGYVPAPHSIYEKVWQLLPGCRMTLDLQTLEQGTDLSQAMEPYWNLPRVVEDAKRRMIDLPEDHVIDEFEDLLRDCVRDRMISDVPLGAFLSGGIDSSLIVALMQQASSRPVKTYAIGFREQGYDEAVYAGKVARHLGTDHHELYVGPHEAMDVIPSLPDIFDEPFADASQIPTYLVSRFARQDVTVALSGDGGDEMFGGYLRHFLVPALWSRVGWMPSSLRVGLGGMIRRLPQEQWDGFAGRYPQFGRRAHKFADLMEADGRQDLYAAQVDRWRDAEAVTGGLCPPHPLTNPAWMPEDLSMTEQMIYNDLLFYLPNDLMVKADRASMAVALEMRAPLLDQRIVEYAWRLPMSFKVRGQGASAKGKWLLRQVLARHVPAELFERPKQGFSVPVEQWLKGGLKDWAQDLLDPSRLRQDGFLDADRVHAVWQAYLAGDSRHADRLWTVLMFQAWRARWHGARNSALAQAG